jgi:hypothetical protein
MSKMSELDMDLQAIRRVMEDPILSAEEQIERKCDWIVRELDELCALASNSETVDLIEGQRIAVGQIVTRAQLIASFLMARQPSGLRLVKNG